MHCSRNVTKMGVLFSIGAQKVNATNIIIEIFLMAQLAIHIYVGYLSNQGNFLEVISAWGQCSSRIGHETRLGLNVARCFIVT